MEGQIYKAIIGVMQDIGAVGKNSKNVQQNFMFRGIDAVMNALNPALIKNKVFAVPEMLEQQREERTTKNGANLIYSICKMQYTFYTEDGSNVQAIVTGEGMDSGDKATNKAMAIAYKYACFQVFCIPTEELRDTDSHMEDPDKQCYETKPKNSTNKSASKKPTGKSEPKESTSKPTSKESASKATPKKSAADTKAQEDQPTEEQPKTIYVTDVMAKSIHSELERTGVKIGTILKMFNIKTLENMTIQQYKSCMRKLEITPSKAEKTEADKNE